MLFRRSLVALLIFINSVAGSVGDWYPEQIQCKYHCEVDNCEYQTSILDEDVNLSSYLYKPSASQVKPNFIDKLLFWDCVSLCDYQCQQLTTDMIMSRMEDTDEQIVQFHGKWPFVRVVYIQEFWSTLFSIGNFIPHFLAYKKLSNIKIQKNKSHLLINNYKLVSIMGSLAWLFSTIFHFRDTLLTERLDYFFAGGTVLSGFYACTMRFLLGGDIHKHKKYGSLGFSICLLIFACHVLRLYLDWSYTYNMRFNIAFGVLQYLMLITIAVKNYHTYRNNRYVSVFKVSVLPVLLVVGTSLSMSFELFDIFIPSFQLDSHAIWHGLTILPSFFLYEFFIQDYKALMGSLMK